MPLELECVAGAIPGKRFPVTDGVAQVFRMFHHGQETGTVVVELQDGQCVVTNRSPHIILVNDCERSRATLVCGDRLAVGRDRFVLRTDTEGVTTQAVTSNAYAPHGRNRSCSVCGGTFLPVTGWTDGTLTLCAACIAKGHSPRSLGEAPALAPRATAIPPPPVAGGSPMPAPASDRAPLRSGAQRQRRTVSASMQAQVEERRGPHLLRRFRAWLAGRADRRHLRGLVEERTTLLLEAGRHALSQAFLGLPEDALATLLGGRRATIDPLDLPRAGLDRWRAARERLALLDAEIAALRVRLGLGPDPQRSVDPLLNLRTQDKARVDRVFASMDAMQTMELDPVAEVERPGTAGAVGTAPLTPKPGRAAASRSA